MATSDETFFEYPPRSNLRPIGDADAKSATRPFMPDDFDSDFAKSEGHSRRRSQANTDLEHLRLLSIFHYVVAGIIVAFSSVFIIHIIIGIMMLSGGLTSSNPRDPPPPAVGWMFVMMGCAINLFG